MLTSPKTGAVSPRESSLAVDLTSPPPPLCSEKNTGYVGPQVRVCHSVLTAHIVLCENVWGDCLSGHTRLGCHLPRKLLRGEHNVIIAEAPLAPRFTLQNRANALKDAMRSASFFAS
jgi:hypothetical protein